MAYYSKLGNIISIPITDSQEYDILIEDSERNIKRVQIKTTGCLKPSGNYEVSLKTCGGNKSGNTIKKMDKKYIDLLFVLTDNGECYSIPTEVITSTSSITLGDNYKQYKVRL